MPDDFWKWLADGITNGRLPLLFGAILLYAAARATMDVLGHTPSAGVRALRQWIPIAAAAICASLAGRRDLAISIVFATSVASLSLVLGAIFAVHPDHDHPHDDSAPNLRRLWVFILPAAVLPFLAGFSGRLTWVHGVMFFIEGAALMLFWMDLDRPQSAPAKPAHHTFDKHYPAPPVDWVKELNIALYIAVAIVGASSAAWGTSKMSQHVTTIWGESIVVAVLAPVLALPMLVSATSPCEKDRAGLAATGAMGVVLLNLCVLLPFVIWSAYISRMGDATSRGMIYSIVTWRVDNVVLIAMALLVLPVALGRWKLGRAEGFALVALYAVYILMEAVGVARA